MARRTGHGGRRALDPDCVAGYDAKSQVDPTEDIKILASLGLGATSTIVDLGAGTGVLAMAAARTGASVIAMDVSPAMVGSLRRRADEQGLGNLTVVQAGFLTYRHAGGPVDFVYTRNAVHQLPTSGRSLPCERSAGSSDCNPERHSENQPVAQIPTHVPAARKPIGSPTSRYHRTRIPAQPARQPA